MNERVRFRFAAPLLFLLAGCLAPVSHRQTLLSSPFALHKLSLDEYPKFSDDAPSDALLLAARRGLVYFRSQPSLKSYSLGLDHWTAMDLADTLEVLIQILETHPQDLDREIRDHFWVYQSTGTDAERTVTFSAYYEHTLAVSLTPTAEYRFPLYGRPPDLVDVDMGAFDENRAGERLAGRAANGKLIPYSTRREIDSGGALRGKNLEVAWAKDPMDVFFLQVEGSGWLNLLGEKEPVRVRYAGNNGRKYRSVGLYMIEKGMIPKEKFNREAMLDYLRAHPGDRQEILNQNPRYVFFQLDRGPSGRETVGSLQVALTPGRSIATDPAVFPPGALAWMDVPGDPPVARFVLNQDEGGAIKGPGRVDYFVGAGPEAEKFAFQFWRPGRFYFLVRKAGGKP